MGQQRPSKLTNSSTLQAKESCSELIFGCELILIFYSSSHGKMPVVVKLFAVPFIVIRISDVFVRTGCVANMQQQQQPHQQHQHNHHHDNGPVRRNASSVSFSTSNVVVYASASPPPPPYTNGAVETEAPGQNWLDEQSAHYAQTCQLRLPHGVHRQDFARPLYRSDIFYSGSIINISEYRSEIQCYYSVYLFMYVCESS